MTAKQDITGCSLATYPLPPCTNCAPLIIQAGVKRVIAPIMSSSISERWGESCKIAEEQFKEVGIEYTLLDYK